MNEQVMYQISASTGKGKVWKIRVDNKGTQSEIVIRSGSFDLKTNKEGKLITNTALVTIGKNIGKSNETTHYTQAVSQAQAKIELKIREGYTDDVTKITSSATLGSGIPKPMLAQKYHPTGAQKGSKTLKQMGILGKEIIIQPKLDGNRCLNKVEKNESEIDVAMFTRKGDLMPVQLAHILTDLSMSAFHANIEKDIPVFLDGELYCDPLLMKFNVVNGLLKAKTVTPEEAEQRKLIKYYIYDIMIDLPYEERKELLESYASDNVVIVPSKVIIATDENIQAELEYWLGLGYEGVMIRQLGIGYENKRSWQLVKVKLFEDREFKLIGFEEDVRSGAPDEDGVIGPRFVGTFIFDLPAELLKELGKPLVDANGKPIKDFKAGASGQSVADREYMLEHPAEFLGKMGTVEYFGWDYRPRFGKFKGIREDGV